MATHGQTVLAVNGGAEDGGERWVAIDTTHTGVPGLGRL